MSPQITIKNDYVLIEPKEGTDFREIQRGVARLFYADGIPEKNRIWVFREGPERFSDEDLHKLKDIIKENYPSAAKINKTAIVIATASQSKLAKSFAQLAENIPQKFKVFSNITDAENWVKE
jgi:hypothetical protein